MIFDADIPEKYLSDALGRRKGTADALVFPLTTQEVSSVQPSSVNALSGPITNKRSIDSNVLVEDGSIVVLGGLLQDDYADIEERVPVLGDLPLLGNLFKNRSRSRKKTNLMVFLRPVVVRDATATDDLSMDRYEMMRAQQRQTPSQPHPLLPVPAPAGLPPWPATGPSATPAPVAPAAPGAPGEAPVARPGSVWQPRGSPAPLLPAARGASTACLISCRRRSASARVSEVRTSTVRASS